MEWGEVSEVMRGAVGWGGVMLCDVELRVTRNEVMRSEVEWSEVMF